jgi:hypothetical protein
MVYGIGWPRLLLIDPNRKMLYLMFIIIHIVLSFILNIFIILNKLKYLHIV